jgi:hypothetical protein
MFDTLGAGLGIFSSKKIPRSTPVCFYPGRYTPPIPALAVANPDGYITPSSSIIMDPNNAYILNLREEPHNGGYIDANKYPSNDPLYSGHLINHAPKGELPNVSHFEFVWDNLMAPGLLEKHKNDDDDLEKLKLFTTHNCKRNSCSDNLVTNETNPEQVKIGGSSSRRRSNDSISSSNPIDDYQHLLNKKKEKALPNHISELLWYVDPVMDTVMYVPPEYKCSGVIFVTNRDIEVNEELFWDYEIKNGEKLYP